MGFHQKIEFAMHCFNIAIYLAVFIAAGVGIKFFLQIMRCSIKHYARQQSLWSNWT